MNDSEEASGKDSPYTNREIREKWHAISSDLQEIKYQTQITNGSVAKLKEQQIFWRGMGVAVVFFITAIIIPAVSFLYYQVFSLPDTINTRVKVGIDDALSNYNIVHQDN